MFFAFCFVLQKFWPGQDYHKGVAWVSHSFCHGFSNDQEIVLRGGSTKKTMWTCWNMLEPQAVCAFDSDFSRIDSSAVDCIENSNAVNAINALQFIFLDWTHVAARREPQTLRSRTTQSLLSFAARKLESSWCKNHGALAGKRLGWWHLV